MKRGHSHTTSKRQRLDLLSVSCYCVAIQSVRAFTPISDPMRNNKNKCEGPDCKRNSPNLAHHESKSHNVRNFGESFAIRMASYQREEDERLVEEGLLFTDETCDVEESTMQRRIFLASMLATTLITPTVAAGYDKAYPVNLDFDNGDSSVNLQSLREERISAKKAEVKKTKADLRSSQPFAFRNKKDIIGSAVWGGALWLLSGSRSNPLVKPIANALYDENTRKGAWVKDRNEGFFAPFPAAFKILIGFIFFLLGILTDRSLLLLAEGESNVVLQLAGVSLIGGASLELGRIASGEKQPTREEGERDQLLVSEFEEFASKKLIAGQGGSVHKSEVINSFRRFFAKYRVENDKYPLVDLEIERLLRRWAKMQGNAEGMSSAGFMKDIQLNTEAEIR